MLTYFFVFLPADLPEDSDDFKPSMDATFDDASDELMEAESIPPVVEEGTFIPLNMIFDKIIFIPFSSFIGRL